MAWHHSIAYLVTALLQGAIIGAERQWHQRIAGLRTNALVSAGAAMFVGISHLVPMNLTSLQVAAQVVSGIGFLGSTRPRPGLADVAERIVVQRCVGFRGVARWRLRYPRPHFRIALGR